jgi:putative transcriptional regulator
MRNRIKELRLECGMTQEQLAKAIGVSRQSVIAIETMKYRPSLELAYRIAKTFRKSIEEVFIFEEEDQ